MTTTMRLISVTPNRGSQRPSLKVKKAGALHPSKLRQVTTPLPRGAVNRKRPFSKRGTTATHFVAAAVCFADDAFTGTWKLNEAKSKIAPNAPKNNTVVYEAAGDNVKITVDGIGSDSKPTHDEWTGKFDGKDYPVTGNPNSDMRSYTKIDEHTLEFNVKKGGKITTSGRVVVSAHGKSRTVTTSGTDSQGKKFKSTAVYEKQ